MHSYFLWAFFFLCLDAPAEVCSSPFADAFLDGCSCLLHGDSSFTGFRPHRWNRGTNHCILWSGLWRTGRRWTPPPHTCHNHNPHHNGMAWCDSRMLNHCNSGRNKMDKSSSSSSAGPLGCLCTSSANAAVHLACGVHWAGHVVWPPLQWWP